MLKAILASVVILVIVGALYPTYRKVFHKAADWQAKTLELSQRCGVLLADRKRASDDVERIKRAAKKLAWKTYVSDDVLRGVVKAADPYQQEVVTAGRALDACINSL